MPPAIFLDRDGVLCRNLAAHVRSRRDFRWLPGAREALARLSRLGLPIFVVTNQSVIGRGLATAMEVRLIHDRMSEAAAQAGGRIDGVYCCPHSPDDGCACRKPGTALFVQAAAEWGADLHRSYLVGDGPHDVEAGRRLGLSPVLVLTGRGPETLEALRGDGQALPVVVRDLGEAAAWIWRAEEVRRGGLLPVEPAARAPAALMGGAR